MIRAHLNVTPLIDVLLVLLIIFMIISPLKPAHIEARVPQPPGINTHERTDFATLSISVRKDGSIDLNESIEYGSLNELPQLTTDLRRIIEERAQSGFHTQDREPKTFQTAFIKAPKSLAYGSVIRVIDAVASSGAYPMSLQIDHLSD